MNEKIKQHLDAIALREGYSIEEDSDYIEIITEGDIIWEGERDSHRWYDLIETVIDAEGLLIGYDRYHITGDNCMADMGLEYDIDGFFLVEPMEVTTTVYKRI